MTALEELIKRIKTKNDQSQKSTSPKFKLVYEGRVMSPEDILKQFIEWLIRLEEGNWRK